MNKIVHNIYIWTMVVITVTVTIYLSVVGYTYYSAPLEERYYLESHDWFKPSGLFGQGLGVIGTFLILFGVVIYIMRKRYNFLGRFIRLKYLLEFHIFLCTLGPIMILFHTAFKFGGIVSVAFWSMVAVVLSGVVGRFIYIQIPHTIEGRQMSLEEIQQMKASISERLHDTDSIDSNLRQLISNTTKDGEEKNSFITRFLKRRKAFGAISKALKSKQIAKKERLEILTMVKEEISLTGRIERLNTMQRLFKNWHVAHLPFALIMLIVVVLHVGVAIAFGYTWIF